MRKGARIELDFVSAQLAFICYYKCVSSDVRIGDTGKCDNGNGFVMFDMFDVTHILPKFFQFFLFKIFQQWIF